MVLDARDGHELAQFYAGLLGRNVAKDEPGGAALAPPDGVAYLGFQTSPDYVPPVWPNVDGRQQTMLHLDIQVTDLDAAVAAVAEGATLATHQPPDKVRVLLDPAGHPFCRYLDA